MSISTESSSRTAPAIDWPTARSFVSGFLLRRMARPEPLGVERHALNGALLVRDVESFTARVERLVSTGPKGLEQVISGFNGYFCAVADTVAQFGEDILDTTGDSCLCFWAAEDDRELADATALAAQVALAVLQTTGGSVLVSADAAALVKHRALLRDTPEGRAELQRVLEPAWEAR